MSFVMCRPGGASAPFRRPAPFFARIVRVAFAALAVSLGTAADAHAELGQVRITEVLFQCSDGTSGKAFVELRAFGPGQSFEPGVHLAAFDGFDRLVFDAVDVFAARVGQSWPQDSTFLLAGATFPSVAGFAPDFTFNPAPVRPAGRIVLYRLDPVDSTRTTLDSLVYTNTTPVAVSPGHSMLRDFEGHCRETPFPSPKTFVGATTVLCPDKSTRLPVLGEAAFRCRDGGTQGQFLELLNSGSGTTCYDSDIGVRAYDHSGALIGEASDVFGSRTGQRWTVGTTFLLGDPRFASITSNGAPDGVLPFALDSLGGRIEVFVSTATGGRTITSTLAYGPGTALPVLPLAGASFVRSGSTYVTRVKPTPTTTAGVALDAGSCLGVILPQLVLRLREYGLQCLDGSGQGQFFEFEPSDAAITFPGGVGLRALGSNGTVLADVPDVFATLAGQAWPAGRPFLLASPALLAGTGIAADALLPTSTSAGSGQLVFYLMVTGEAATLQSIAYGSGTPRPSPAPGLSRRYEQGAYVEELRPSPENFAGQKLPPTGCYAGSSLGIRVAEFGTACIDGGERGQFVEFTTTRALYYHSRFRIRFYDHLGGFAGEHATPFANRLGQLWPAARSHLLAAPTFAESVSQPPDEYLPVTLDSVGGRVDVLDIAPGDTLVVESMAYGPGFAIPAPGPGHSVEILPGGGFLEREAPTPVNSHDQVVTAGLCLPPADPGFRIAEVAFSCADASVAAQFVEVVSERTRTLEGDIGLHVFGRTGDFRFTVAPLFRGRLLQTIPAGGKFLLANSGFGAKLGLGPDDALPGLLDPAGGMLLLYRSVEGEDLPIQTFAYGPGATMPPPMGTSLARRPDGSYAPTAPATPENFSGQTVQPSVCLPASFESFPLISEAALGCLASGVSGQFVELGNPGVNPIFDPTLRLRWFNREGTKIAEMTSPFGVRAGQPWPYPWSWLLANPGYVADGGALPDGALADTLDRLAGRLELYRVAADSEVVLRTVRYGAGAPAPKPGQSLDVVQSKVGVPTPLNSVGDTLRIVECPYPARDSHPWIREVMVRCAMGGVGGQFIELAASGDSLRLHPCVGLRAFDHLGGLVVELPHMSNSGQTLLWPADRSLLLGALDLNYSANVPASYGWSGALDTLGGRIELFFDCGDAKYVIDALAYGPGFVPLPRRGYSLQRDTRGAAWGEATPTPTNLLLQSSVPGQCYAGCQPTYCSVASPPWSTDASLDLTSSGVRFSLPDGSFWFSGRPRLQMLDDFVIEGLPAGTPVDFQVVLSGRVDERSCYCYYYGTWHGWVCYGHAYAVASLIDVASGRSVTSPRATGDFEQRISQHATAGTPFRMRLDASVATDWTASDCYATGSGRMYFVGLPPGAVVRSCHGYVQDGPVPVLVSTTETTLAPGRVTIVWRLTDATGLAATVQRRVRGDAAWAELATLPTDGDGRLSFVDDSVAPGGHYEYRLAWHDEQLGSGQSAWTAVDVPMPWRFTLAEVRPNPTSGPIEVAFQLPRDGEAVLELFDVAGRRVHEQRQRTEAGDHVVPLAAGSTLRPGLYLLRLRFEGERATRRVIVSR